MRDVRIQEARLGNATFVGGSMAPNFAISIIQAFELVKNSNR